MIKSIATLPKPSLKEVLGLVGLGVSHRGRGWSG